MHKVDAGAWVAHALIIDSDPIRRLASIYQRRDVRKKCAVECMVEEEGMPKKAKVLSGTSLCSLYRRLQVVRLERGRL